MLSTPVLRRLAGRISPRGCSSRVLSTAEDTTLPTASTSTPKHPVPSGMQTPITTKIPPRSKAYPTWNSPVLSRAGAASNVNASQYMETYERSIGEDSSDAFWAAEARKRLSWFKDFTRTRESNFDVREGPIEIEWFGGGELNISYNCVDRHVLAGHGDRTAIIWEGDDKRETRHISYRDLQDEVSKLANVLRNDLGVRKGDRVSICLPMIPEAVFSMLACARIGAVHSVIFGGFSADAVMGRVVDCQSKVVITADGGLRGNKVVPLKSIVDAALDLVPPAEASVESVLVVDRLADSILHHHKAADAYGAKGGEGKPPATTTCYTSPTRDVSYRAAVAAASADCPPESMGSEDPLFILYTSGSTGKPKGVLHSSAGYLLGASMTHEHTFDHREGDVFWCTADCGWITGHTYSVYGPLANGGTTVVFEGVPSHPSPARFWKIVDRYAVTQMYTAPTALRALMAEGDHHVTGSSSRKSLRVLGTVGEPINATAWEWYNDVVGRGGACAIVDTWWQTETGAHMLTPLPGASEPKAGSCVQPYFGVQPALVDDATGELVEGNPAEGALVLERPWPSMMRTIYGDHRRFEDAYFGDYPGRYFTGDRARRDEDGYYWITGRTDDVINVSGHRLGTAEVEAAIMTHPDVAKAAVVGFPHELKGTGIYAYVVPKDAEYDDAEALQVAVRGAVRKVIGPVASPDVVQVTRAVPETRSGKIMRRILRKVAEGEVDLADFGDTSTLLDPTIVPELISGRQDLCGAVEEAA